AIGTGPYKFQDHLKGVSFSTVRNPDYFVKGRPYLDGIMTYIIPDSASQFSALRTGRIDFFPAYPELTLAQREIMTKDKSPIIIQTRRGLSFRSSLFNIKRKPWDDPRVRRAVSLASDRVAMMQVAEQGDGALGGALPPGPWSIPDEELKQIPGYRYPKDADVAEAKKLMAEAGFPDGLDVTFVTRNEVVYVNNAIALQNEVRKLGIRAKVQPLERAASYTAQQTGNFDVYSGSSAIRLDDPSELGLQYVTGAGKNYGFYSNPKVDSLFDQLLISIDPAKQRAAAVEIQKILLQDNPQIIHYWKNYSVSFWPYVKNYKIGDMYNHNRMRDVWLDK
ncbi:MAG: ABC transporter substrate-binding protein, partial [Chloroflexota bacterium]|nr:ABC transporter substrate-binding protein [Chloroflexota bacterium]